MKRIKVYDANIDKITEALSEAQKGCKANTLDAWGVFKVIKGFNNRFRIGDHNSLLTKKALEGSSLLYYVEIGKYSGRASKYTLMTTAIRCEFSKGSWYLSGVCRVEAPKDHFEVHLSQTAKDHLIQTMSNF